MLSFHNVDKRKNSIATAPAFAQTTVYQAIPNTTPSVELPTQPTQATDLSFAFEDTQNLQATVMTDSQMQETEGAALPLVYMGGAAFIGGVYNLGSYAHNVPQSQRTWRGYATAFGGGAVGGAISATPIGAIRAPVIGGGIILGGSHYSNKIRK
ncbi:hypothetical protein AAX06_00325 [Moraxella bovoculi]|uniref:Uncharacterized protein n=1 Tax=Moraxella bovoculi TaxID=386891 RepID=A0AAC8PWJ1_9GAMM|nr:hypothetical protein [Moraxella bovoculi]AKG06899.1 hypothetical protein AAX06_00325 [Moraxella bovoculi]